MKVFTCSNCNNLIYFENNICLNCKFPVGFDATSLSIVTLKSQPDNQFSDIQNKQQVYNYCKNAEYSVCNWLIPVNGATPYCVSCDLNRTIPDLTDKKNLQLWANIEAAKHRMIYTLIRLHLPLKKKIGTEETGLAFNFLGNTASEKVITSQEQGLITLNIDEADEAERVKHKTELGEHYRTLLGHFRHEIGHYYWDVLLKYAPDKLAACRAIFGDDSKDYDEALKVHYKNGAPVNWSENYISSYATSHPWEDWAETWAHYMHLMDTLETANAFGINIKPDTEEIVPGTAVSLKKDPFEIRDFGKIFNAWLPLTFAVNSLNRSMGYADFYPFVIPEPVVKKLQFIHELCLNQHPN
jgi:hypothetical protein